MIDRIFQRAGHHFIVVMMLFTRGFAVLTGALCIPYVLFTFKLPRSTAVSFTITAAVFILLAVVLTTLQGLWETRHLRRLLKLLRMGLPAEKTLQTAGSREAVTFPGRHARNEGLLDPFITIFPICVTLHLVDNTPWSVLLQVFFAGFLGLSCILLLTFFVSDRWMRRVVTYLLQQGVAIRFDEIPPARMATRLQIGFGIIILMTAIMIGSVANQRAMEIVASPDGQIAAVSSLRLHTVFLTISALAVGMAYARMLARSVSTRVDNLVKVMQQVQRGELSQRVESAGNDEIDTLARQFNTMVEELDLKDRDVRDLNVNLEKKVRSRTRQLARSKKSLQESVKQLRETDRIKTEFFSNISHELRTPLLMILSPLEQLLRKEQASLTKNGLSLVDVASMNGQRLLKQINQLLDFAKIDAGCVRLSAGRVDVNRLVINLAAAARPLVEQRGLSLHVELEDNVPEIIADGEKLDTVITNLVSNAIKFTPAGGSITISTRMAPTEDGVLTADSVSVCVSDTGIGIPAEHLPRLFARFVQVDGSTSREFAGTGLGLALAKELVELHGGEIHASSRPGQGSRFWLNLPLLYAASPLTGTSLPVGPEAPGDDGAPPVPVDRFADLVQCTTFLSPDTFEQTVADDDDRWTVLVVDDNAEVRKLTGSILADEYRIVYAEDGQQGIEAVRRHKPDLIVSDVMMPRVDGYEFCRRVKADADTAHVPFILVTAKAELAMKIEGLNCGADDYISKPFHAEELLARSRSLLRLREMHRELEEHNSTLTETLLELQRTQRQLVQSEKMSSLGQLVAGVTHEINNSINAVTNGIPGMMTRIDRLQELVERALENPGDNGQASEKILQAFQKVRTLADVVENGAERTARVIVDMKKFAHPGHEATGVFDLNSALEVCVNLTHSQFRERIQFHKLLEPVPTLMGPYQPLNQVFLNLLTNAAQAMPGGGDIFVSTQHVEERIVVRVRDTGCGIPQEIRSRIFDPFFTTKEPGEGTGLGLSISYGVVTRLGGSIECRSQEGIGTEFVIVLPTGHFAADGVRKLSDVPALSKGEAVAVGMESASVRSGTPSNALAINES